MGLARQRLERYLGSRHSAVGLWLAILGLPSLLAGLVFAVTAPVEFPLSISLSMAGWGLLALPLGVSMRRKRPVWPLWLLANALLVIALLAAYYVLYFDRLGSFLERNSNG